MTKRSNTGSTADDENGIKRSILAYLHAHPQAADTLRGIVDWWLPQQRYESDCERIGRVLDQLVADGLLHRAGLPDGEVLYTLSKQTKPPD